MLSRALGRGRTVRIQRPRHILVYRAAHADQVEIVRVVHDAMELARHIPNDDPPAGDATR